MSAVTSIATSNLGALFIRDNKATVSTCHECEIKMHLPVTYSLSLGFFMMLWLRLKPEIWLLHLDASAIEKIRIVFIDEPLTGFGLIYNLLFAMAFSANCNFTIVYCFRVGFPKMKWAEAPPKNHV